MYFRVRSEIDSFEGTHLLFLFMGFAIVGVEVAKFEYMLDTMIILEWHITIAFKKVC